jgi:DNA-binding GntR family transcriptional regulator
VQRPVPVPVLLVEPAGLPVTGTLRDRVVAILREAIVSGRLAPATRLSEPSLARELKVSRGPVREAIRELAAEGLVRIEARVGTFVTRPDPSEVNELFEVQAVLDGLAARLAAESGTEAGRRAALLPHLEALDAAGRPGGDRSEYLRRARRFHEAVYELSGNTRLATLHRTQLDQMMRLLGPIVRPDLTLQLDREHRAIASAVIAGRSMEAERTARAHAGRAGERLISGVDDRPPARRAR